MNLGIDFDGTIADSTQQKIQTALELYGVVMKPEQAGRGPGRKLMGKHRYENVINSIYGTEKTLCLSPLEGSLEVIGSLSDNHEIYVVTARDKKSAKLASSWLNSRRLPVRKLLYTSKSGKLSVCKEHDIKLMLDDSPSVLSEFVNGGIVPVLLSRPYNAGSALGEDARWVKDWYHFMNLVEELSSALSRPFN